MPKKSKDSKGQQTDRFQEKETRAKKHRGKFSGKSEDKASFNKKRRHSGKFEESKPSTPESDFKNRNASKKLGGRPDIEDTETPNKQTRLNKYIANSGVCSRREADKLIEAGEISVNGKVVTELGYKINQDDSIKYGNKVLKLEKFVYVLLNKPKDFITTTSDPENRKTVMQLVSSACEERIYPVGRLDRNTTGLILLTNDGSLAKKLSHPSHMVKKLYQVDIDKPITDEDFIKIQEGLTLEDGLAQVDEMGIVTPDRKSLGLEIHIGRNRIVRRIFEHLGYEVVKLDRVMYAGLTKRDLPRGKWRYLSEKEVIKLKYLK